LSHASESLQCTGVHPVVDAPGAPRSHTSWGPHAVAPGMSHVFATQSPLEQAFVPVHVAGSHSGMHVWLPQSPAAQTKPG
jgi:hypothetical protein